MHISDIHFSRPGILVLMEEWNHALKIRHLEIGNKVYFSDIAFKERKQYPHGSQAHHPRISGVSSEK